MVKLLITGATGLLGSKLVTTALQQHFEVVVAYHTQPIKADYRRLHLDLGSESKVIKSITKERPDVVIHTAALTNVDYCEENKAAAQKINVDGTRCVVKACEKVGADLIFISTDYVFDGEKGMYKEEDITSPINYYGLTKLEGERIIENSELDYIIVRTSVLYGWTLKRKLNFVTWVIKMLKQEREINVASDQFGSPTFVDHLAEVLLGMCKKNLRGVFHGAGSERISRFDFATKIARIFKLEEKLIKPVTSETLKQRARRPRDSSLAVDKVEKMLNIKMLNTTEGLTLMRKEMK